MLKEEKQKSGLQMASAQTQEVKLLEETRQSIYIQAANLNVNEETASEAASRPVAPNCVKFIVRTMFPNPLKEYNGMIDEDRE